MSETPAERACTELRNDLASLLNRACAENGSGTPDHVLADYLLGCLDAWDAATRARDSWWGRKPLIGGVISAYETPVPPVDATEVQP